MGFFFLDLYNITYLNYLFFDTEFSLRMGSSNEIYGLHKLMSILSYTQIDFNADNTAHWFE